MRKGWWIAMCSLGLAVSATLAENGIVRTRSGQSLEGDITEKENQVIIVRKKNAADRGIETRLLKDDVLSIQYFGNMEEQIRAELAKLKNDDAAGRLALARRAFDGHKYDLCRQIANEALAIDANNKEVVDLLELVRRQIALEARAAARTPDTPSAETPAVKPSASRPTELRGPGDSLPKQYLSDDDINAIRQAELQPADQRIRVRFMNNVLRRFQVLPGVNQDEFAAMSAYQQAATILDRGDKRMWKDVIIQDDPVAFRTYRSNVQKIVVTGCAGINCHGTTAGGNFVIFPVYEPEAASYTNFYLLNKYSRKTGQSTGGVFSGQPSSARMIDRLRPDRSLLLQYGLPRRDADLPHPDVPGFKQTYNNTQDVAYQRVFRWISENLRQQVDPENYRVSYTGPEARPATPPATPTETPKTK